MKDNDDTEDLNNVIPFPGPPPLLDGSYTCEGWAPRVASITAWAPVAPVYNLDNKEDFMAYMAAEMHVALKIQGLFGVEEANKWVQFHRGFDQDDVGGEPEDNDE